MYLRSRPRALLVTARVSVVVAALAASAGILAIQRTQLPQLLSLPLVPFYVLRSAALALYVVVVGVLTGRVVLSRAPMAIRRVSLLLFAVLLCPALLEGVLMLTPRSHGNGSTLAHVVWSRYYWGTPNSLAYRDAAFTPSADARLTKVICVGDSFTAGAGVKQRSDRFSDRLQAALGAGTRVYNAGLSGSDTINEFERLVAFPVIPDVVILQYFGNDIERRVSLYDPREPSDTLPAAASRPGAPPGLATRLANDVVTRLAGSRAIASCNYLLFACNYLANLAPLQTSGYADEMLRYFASPSVWHAHEQDLRQFIAYAKAHRARLIVVVFPFLQQPESSRYWTQKVSAVFRREGIPVVDLTDDVLPLSIADRVVNSSDPHASPRVHQIAADRILQVLRTP
jgi:hypothetical protein